MCVQRYKNIGIYFVTLCLQLQCITGNHVPCLDGQYSTSGNRCEDGNSEYRTFQCLQVRFTTNTHANQANWCSANNGRITMFTTATEKTHLRDFPK